MDIDKLNRLSQSIRDVNTFLMVLEANQKGSITLESDVWDDNQVRKHATIRLHQLSKDHELRKFLISYFKDRMNSYRKEMIEILEVE